jgi:hypothetical protein
MGVKFGFPFTHFAGRRRPYLSAYFGFGYFFSGSNPLWKPANLNLLIAVRFFAYTALPVWVVLAKLAIFCMLGLCTEFGRLDPLTSLTAVFRVAIFF